MLFILLRIAALSYGGFVLLLFIFQSRIIFPRGGMLDATPSDQGWPFEEVTVAVHGEKTHGWFVPAEHPSRGVLLFSHGNAGTIAHRLDSIDIFTSLGMDVLIYDYGGYGLSSGRPSEKRCFADVRAMWDYLTKQRGIDPARIVLFGRSLGGGPTCQLGLETEPAAVILESSFTSIADMAWHQFPFIPARLLVKHRFDNASKIGRLRCPVIVIHSPEDEIVPYSHGRRLFEAAPEPKTFLEISGTHNDGYYTSGMAYTAGLDRFLDQVLGPSGSTR